MSLPPKVKSILKASGHTSHQRAMNTLRADISSASNVIRHSIARQVDEMGPAAARAADKILALPK